MAQGLWSAWGFLVLPLLVSKQWHYCKSNIANAVVWRVELEDHGEIWTYRVQVQTSVDHCPLFLRGQPFLKQNQGGFAHQAETAQLRGQGLQQQRLRDWPHCVSTAMLLYVVTVFKCRRLGEPTLWRNTIRYDHCGRPQTCYPLPWGSTDNFWFLVPLLRCCYLCVAE